MKKLLIILVLAVMYSSVARGDDLEDGYIAYEKGDYATALKLWRPLAMQGDTYAQSILGVMYHNGQGVIQDYKESIKWYRKAAEQGDAYAQFNLALMYDNGKKGVIQDYKEAAKYYRLAAKQGDAGAQFNLGFMYGKGQGVIRELVRAYMWLDLSASNGEKLGNKGRDLTAKEMTPVQISRARNMAQDCKNKKYKNCY